MRVSNAGTFHGASKYGANEKREMKKTASAFVFEKERESQQQRERAKIFLYKKLHDEMDIALI